MQSFDFHLRTRIVRGAGALAQLGELAAEVLALAGDGRRVLLVSDPGIVAAGHVQRGVDSLTTAGLEVQLFDGAQENPTTDNICLLYTSPSPRDRQKSRMPSSA